ncbi:MAG TPA: 4-(cytidine 5'-diphospho)-2-C-methyl-D-erythritol kinase [Anaerohalosphaeraceae bacterium]|nr:4-(cytidine 5'-diphospho)-2-C-methyl-D-erythritol kinase [Anaerohalosphaeraceae bacterium]HOL88255.1 4-(cytidine 5'-diphospho)-2-C-methyl-D-erythritol kinase [Anaerohalosphaeraceae bacterium]HPP56665.1 4-(cytidine 5'-diphospho)-2-C-methyl-D-erythritol kinase [Anaerohalosphaeraceae bacterium]
MNAAAEQYSQFEQKEKGLLVRAPAKINLSLLVAGRRADGYHELETVMAKIDWMDELLLEPSCGDGLELICRGPYAVPEGPDNLVWKAWQQVCGHIGRPLPVRITLCKNIPAGTGLGSGSSDAAAALLGLNRFFQLNLPEGAIFDMSCRLGSDVAFFLDGPVAFCTGRGEKIKKIPDFPDFRALLIVPNVSVSTKMVYENYIHDPERFETLREQINDSLSKKSIDSLAKICANMLQTSCFHLHRELADLKGEVERLCARKVCLSGSGSAMFMLFEKDCDAKIQTCRQLLDRNLGILCRIVNNNRW